MLESQEEEEVWVSSPIHRIHWLSVDEDQGGAPSVLSRVENKTDCVVWSTRQLVRNDKGSCCWCNFTLLSVEYSSREELKSWEGKVHVWHWLRASFLELVQQNSERYRYEKGMNQDGQGTLRQAPNDGHLTSHEWSLNTYHQNELHTNRT